MSYGSYKISLIWWIKLMLIIHILIFLLICNLQLLVSASSWFKNQDDDLETERFSSKALKSKYDFLFCEYENHYSIGGSVVPQFKWTKYELYNNGISFHAGGSQEGKNQELVEIWAENWMRIRWTTYMDREETICLFQGRLTSLNRSFGRWTATMRTTVLLQFQLWQKIWFRMSRRFSKLLMELHFLFPQLVTCTHG